MTITVVVLDLNDNRPLFSEDLYNVELVENRPAGILYAHTTCTVGLGITDILPFRNSCSDSRGN